MATVLIVAGGSAAAQDSPVDFLKRMFQPPADVVTEVFRPAARPAPKLPAKAPAETDLFDVPMPHLRPGDAAATPLLGYAPVTGPPAVTAPAPHPAPDVAALPANPLAPTARSTCRAALTQLGVEASVLAPIEEGQCGIATPVAVASLGNGAIDFSTKAIIGCDLAETLATWLGRTVQPEAQAILGGRVDGIRVAASYACRTRDSIPGAKMSEHAFGRAIDISAFRVGGNWIDVQSGWDSGGPEADFLAAVRSSACGPFKTVLGPGADEYHTNHFHLDLEPRRNGGTYCE